MKTMYRSISIAMICLLGSLPIASQELNTADHLLRLKEGVLLVKLYSRNKSVEALKERGYDDKAEILKKEQHFENIAIANAFEMYYKFTPKVYFFYSDDSRKIAEQDFEGVLMGYNLEKLNNVSVEDTAFYVAEFGHTEGKNLRALVVRDNNLEYMKAPFPYFVRTFEGFLFFDRTYPKVVNLWNDKLLEEYSKYFVMPELGNSSR